MDFRDKNGQDHAERGWEVVRAETRVLALEIHEVRPNVEVLRHRKGMGTQGGILGTLEKNSQIAGWWCCVLRWYLKREGLAEVDWIEQLPYGVVAVPSHSCGNYLAHGFLLFFFFRFCPHYFITFRLKIIDYFSYCQKIKHKALENLNYTLNLKDEQLLK